MDMVAVGICLSFSGDSVFFSINVSCVLLGGSLKLLLLLYGSLVMGKGV